MSETLKVTDFEVSLLIIERNACQFKIEQIDELLNRIGEAKGIPDAGKQAPAVPEAKNDPAAVQEITFTTLKFDPQKGAKLGDYDVAFKESNLADKFRYAFSVLKHSNATIQNRYHGQGYEYSYWVYGEDRIYRQKLKSKAKLYGENL